MTQEQKFIEQTFLNIFKDYKILIHCNAYDEIYYWTQDGNFLMYYGKNHEYIWISEPRIVDVIEKHIVNYSGDIRLYIRILITNMLNKYFYSHFKIENKTVVTTSYVTEIFKD